MASMLRAQRRDPAKTQAKCAFATNYPLANRQLRSPLILRYRMQGDKQNSQLRKDAMNVARRVYKNSPRCSPCHGARPHAHVARSRRSHVRTPSFAIAEFRRGLGAGPAFGLASVPWIGGPASRIGLRRRPSRSTRVVRAWPNYGYIGYRIHVSMESGTERKKTLSRATPAPATAVRPSTPPKRARS